MKTLLISLAILAAQPGFAQTLPAPDAPAETEEGFDLMEEGAKLLFRGLLREMEPALNEMGKALEDIEPAMKDLLALIDDIRNYDAPRILENGDILIPRRKGVPLPVPMPAPGGEIEL